MQWKYPYDYPAPSGLKLDGDNLKWKEITPSDKEIVRYTVYAIPNSVKIEDAMDEFGDGISGDYLLGVTYSPSKKVPQGDYTYAVCSYTPQSTESRPVFLKR